ncbi:hypothetical protein C5O80_23710 [Burkholderia sp. SRS-46]|nr:hypothetical protein C5O80_23710 [Burkholderia sp. SRS-46]
MLSFFLRRGFRPRAVRDIHISGPYSSARADEVTPNQRHGAVPAPNRPSQHRRSHQSRASSAGLPFPATQLIATWTVNR